jgi:hypothetical protein
LHSGSLEQHIEELRHANAILRSGTPPPSNQDRELQVAYHRLSEAEHGWHYFRQQLQVLQLQVPPATAAPAAPTEPDAKSDVDEEYVVGHVEKAGWTAFCYFEWIGYASK